MDELKMNLDNIGNLPLLIPGVGAQGGNLEEVTTALISSDKKSFLINVSRGIIHKSFNVDFAEAARSELVSLNQTIAHILKS